MTGVFGAGYGNIGRWDVFGMYMGITIGGCCLSLVTLCACFICVRGGKETILIPERNRVVSME